MSEIVGHKNTDHTISYLLHYLETTGKVPEWVRRVHLFLDNAGSTNKNQFLMGAVFEIMERNILQYFRVSFMIAGHTKFAPDRLFAVLAKTSYSSDVLNNISINNMQTLPLIMAKLSDVGVKLSPRSTQICLGFECSMIL